MLEIIASALIVFAPAAPPSGGYETCAQAAEDGRTDIPRDDPGYQPDLDRDGDGIGCESQN